MLSRGTDKGDLCMACVALNMEEATTVRYANRCTKQVGFGSEKSTCIYSTRTLQAEAKCEELSPIGSTRTFEQPLDEKEGSG